MGCCGSILAVAFESRLGLKSADRAAVAQLKQHWEGSSDETGGASEVDDIARQITSLLREGANWDSRVQQVSRTLAMFSVFHFLIAALETLRGRCAAEANGARSPCNLYPPCMPPYTDS